MFEDKNVCVECEALIKPEKVEFIPSVNNTAITQIQGTQHFRKIDIGMDQWSKNDRYYIFLVNL